MKNKGGLLVGATDKNNGKGIKVLAPEGEIIMGGGEIVISENAATKHCELLSEINQSGGGVAFPCDAQKTANKGPLESGGKLNKENMENTDKKASEIGIETEKEHTNLYNELKARLEADGHKMPMSLKEFATWIAAAHEAENKDYYPMLLKYVEQKQMDGGGSVEEKISEIKEVEKSATTLAEQKNDEVRATVAINTNSVNNWDKIPAPWKNTKTIAEVKYINSPYDKGLLNILKPFFSSDELRPVMLGVNFDDVAITCTDAHKLICLPYPNKKYKGVYLTGPIKPSNDPNVKKDMFTGKYPNYAAVIPKAEDGTKYQFSIYKCLQYTRVAQEYCNKATWQAVYKFGDQAIGFNTEFLIEELETLLKLGHTTAYAFVKKPNNAMVLSPDANYEVGKSEILLQMPVMLNNADGGKIEQRYYGARYLDFARELNVYFDFTDDQIHNADGSVAEFKMHYGEYEVLDADVIKLLNGYAKAGSKGWLPILENFIVENNKIIATDIETTVIIQNTSPKLTTGVYRIVNGAAEFDGFAEIGDYPKEPEVGAPQFQMVISSYILDYYLDKAYDFTGNDELRPVMSGFNLKYEGGKLFLNATNAHVLFKADITRYAEFPKDQADFSVIISKQKLLEFFKMIGDNPITLKADGKHTVIESPTAKFITRNIDGKFPNVDQVIPKNNTKTLTLNIKDLYNCIKGPEAAKFIKDHKKQSPAIYDKPGMEPGTLDVYLGYHNTEKGVVVLQEEIKICTIPYNFEQSTTTIEPGNSLLLIMPIMNDRSGYFAFQEKLFHQILDTCSKEEIILEFSEPNKAYIISGECFEFGKTVTAIKKVKPIIVPVTPEQEWKDALATLVNNDSPDAKEAAETLQMLLTTTYEGGGVIPLEEIDAAQMKDQFGKN